MSPAFSAGRAIDDYLSIQLPKPKRERSNVSFDQLSPRFCACYTVVPAAGKSTPEDSGWIAINFAKKIVNTSRRCHIGIFVPTGIAIGTVQDPTRALGIVPELSNDRLDQSTSILEMRSFFEKGE